MVKVVLVTGCSTGGIGFALCEEFAKQSCKVYATSRSIDTMKGFSTDNIVRMTLDVTSDADVKRVVKHIVDTEGKIDIVVNNAGVTSRGPLIDVSEDHVQQVFETNTFSIIRVARAVIPEMAKRKQGLIVNIGSISGELFSPWNGIYCASKAAVHALSDVLSMECRPFNINVMLVNAGAVRSNMAKNTLSDLSLSADSLYAPFVASILERKGVSQSKAAMPTIVFAKKVVAKALKACPPVHMLLGGYVIAFTVLKWLPKTWVLSLMWNRSKG